MCGPIFPEIKGWENCQLFYQNHDDDDDDDDELYSCVDVFS